MNVSVCQTVLDLSDFPYKFDFKGYFRILAFEDYISILKLMKNQAVTLYPPS